MTTLGPTVGEAMLTVPKVCAPTARAEDLWALFADDHVHAALVVDEGRLLTVVERRDLAGVDPEAPAASLGALAGRTVSAGTPLDAVHRHMLDRGIRRLAVVDEGLRLLGLLCLKRSGTGFCSDEGVAERAVERDRREWSPGPDLAYDAVVLAGGRATRMGGTDKTGLVVGGLSLVDRVRGAVGGAVRTVVVGPEVDGGPVAAIAAALPRLSADLVVTLAGDLPFIGGGIRPLLDAVREGGDAAVLVAGGRRQHLAAAWRRAALVEAVARLDSPVGSPVRRLFDGVGVVEVPDLVGWSTDVDTPADLEAARAAASL